MEHSIVKPLSSALVIWVTMKGKTFQAINELIFKSPLRYFIRYLAILRSVDDSTGICCFDNVLCILCPVIMSCALIMSCELSNPF